MSDAIKLKVLPQFPSRLTGRAGIDVTKVVRLTEALNRAEERLPGR